MPNVIIDVFKKTRVLLPVIHLPEDGRQVLAAVQIAMQAGADGVFLINQGTSTRNIVENLIPKIRKEFGPQLWVGVNALGCPVEEVVGMSGRSPESRIDGIWSDDAGVDSLRDDEFDTARSRFLESRKSTGWTGLYFGGTAFKTQADIPSGKLALVAQRSASFVDVVTTSGRSTGLAADTEKVRILRKAIPDVPLGLASGITPENVDSYLPHVEAYLVATGIESSFGVLDPVRTRLLADRIHEWPLLDPATAPQAAERLTC
jgi:uncharacterized protein